MDYQNPIERVGSNKHDPSLGTAGATQAHRRAIIRSNTKDKRDQAGCTQLVGGSGGKVGEPDIGHGPACQPALASLSEKHKYTLALIAGAGSIGVEFGSSDVAGALGITQRHARRIIADLEAQGHTERVLRGGRAVARRIDPVQEVPIPVPAYEPPPPPPPPSVQQKPLREKVVVPSVWEHKYRSLRKPGVCQAYLSQEKARIVRSIFERYQPEDITRAAWEQLAGDYVKFPLSYLATFANEHGELEAHMLRKRPEPEVRPSNQAPKPKTQPEPENKLTPARWREAMSKALEGANASEEHEDQAKQRPESEARPSPLSSGREGDALRLSRRTQTAGGNHTPSRSILSESPPSGVRNDEGDLGQGPSPRGLRDREPPAGRHVSRQEPPNLSERAGGQNTDNGEVGDVGGPSGGSLTAEEATRALLKNIRHGILVDASDDLH